MTSSWLREAITSALERDPVDAAYDAKVLSGLMNVRMQEKLRLWINNKAMES